MNVRCFRDDYNSPRPPPETNNGQNNPAKKEEKKIDEAIPESPKPQSMAFTIDFDDGKTLDKSRYENLMKKSQARHQRVQSMSASWQRPNASPSLNQTRPPMSAKLPRKAHGYHSEGYFSSDQEESYFGSFPKHSLHSQASDTRKQTNSNFSPVAQERDSFRSKSSKFELNLASDNFEFVIPKTSKSPIVDGIMSRSDVLPSRQGLILPIKHPLNSNSSDSTQSPNCGSITPTNYEDFTPVNNSNRSPGDVQMLADTSSPELDMLTPDNILQTPDTPLQPSRKSSAGNILKGVSPGVTALKGGLSIQKSPLLVRKTDGNLSPSSTVSEAGTYTIDADNYTEEQKAKMNIDEIFHVNQFEEPLREALHKMTHNSTSILKDDSRFSLPRDFVITKEPKSGQSFPCGIREELLLAKSIPDTVRKVSTDKNVLEISCCYESPTESLEQMQNASNKQAKQAKGYLDKIKHRVKNISEKTFQKIPPQRPTEISTSSQDFGSFTSVTASGVLGSITTVNQANTQKERIFRKNSLTKSQMDSSEYVHKIHSRDNLVLQTVSNESFTPVHDRSDPIMAVSLDSGKTAAIKSPEQILVGKLSHISLNRCKGDKSWIQEWADSVKKHNKEAAAMGGMPAGSDATLAGLPPVSPRHSAIIKGGVASPVRSTSSACSSPSKIPSPVGTLVRQRPPIPDILSSTPDTESYLLSTQNVITNLQAKLQDSRNNSPQLSLERQADSLQDKYGLLTRLPVSQLSRSNSLNYRLHRKTTSSNESSPLRNPGKYLITGNHGNTDLNDRFLLANLCASKSLDTEQNLTKVHRSNSPLTYVNQYKPAQRNKCYDSAELQEKLNKAKHMRHHSFDARNEALHKFNNFVVDYNNANNAMTRSLNVEKSVFDDLGKPHNRTVTNMVNEYRNIDQIKNAASPGNHKNNLKTTHVRNSSYGQQHVKNTSKKPVELSSPIRRSSSFNVVNKNNNVYDKNLLNSPVPNRVSSANSGMRNNLRNLNMPPRNKTPEVDCMSEDSDNLSTGGFYSDYDRKSLRKTDIGVDILSGTRYNRAFALRRARLASPDFRGQNQNASKCPGTPEMRRKFSNSPEVRQKALTRDSRSCTRKVEENSFASNARGKKATDPGRNSVGPSTRLTRSSSAAKDFQPKSTEKSTNKKQCALRDIEFTNWKKRASYDPLKAAQEGKKKPLSSSANNQAPHSTSPSSGSGPLADRVELLLQESGDMSSDSEDRLICTIQGAGSSEAELELQECISNQPDVTKPSRKMPQNNQFTLGPDYVAKFHVNDTGSVKRLLAAERRKTAPRPLVLSGGVCEVAGGGGGPRTPPVDSSSTTSSTTGGEDCGEVQHVTVTLRGNTRSVAPQQRHSGDFSISSTTTSTSRDPPSSSSRPAAAAAAGGTGRPVQPRYMDISRFKAEQPPPAKNFLRRDPSKTYVNVLPSNEHRQQAKRNTVKQEQELKNKELEKWKRRASYDPRKAAAQAKTKPATKTSSSVLRSQSFHGPMTQTTKLSCGVLDKSMGESFFQDVCSDNEF